MNLRKRVLAIETSLTPTQVVLLWLKEEAEEDFEAAAARILKERDQQPHIRVPRMAMAAVRKSFEGLPPDIVYEGQVEAWGEAAFLVALQQEVVALTLGVNTTTSCDLFHSTLDRLLATSNPPQTEAQDAATIIRLRDLLVKVIGETWRLRAVISETAKRYFDGHRILHPVFQQRVDLMVESAWLNTQLYNTLENEFPSWQAADLTSVYSSVRAEMPAVVEGLVARAKIRMQQTRAVSFVVPR